MSIHFSPRRKYIGLIVIVAIIVGVILYFYFSTRLKPPPISVQDSIKKIEKSSLHDIKGNNFSDSFLDERFNKPLIEADNYKNSDKQEEAQYKFKKYFSVYNVLVAQYYFNKKDPQIKGEIEKIRAYMEVAFPDQYQAASKTRPDIWTLQ